MNFKNSPLFVVLLLLIMGQPVMAEIYEPGRGILLPKRQQADSSKNDKKNIDVIKKRNSAPVVVNKQGVTMPNGTVQGVIAPNKQDGNAQKLTSAYAAHLYTSVCSQEYRNRLVSITEENINRQKMWADIQTSCKCMSNQILSVVPATDLADYVMYAYAAPVGQNDPQAASYVAQKGGRIDQLILSGALQRKCGFLN